MGAIPQDCVEYGTYKTETRKEGITFALQTFANKLTAAVATIITGGVLTFVGYDVAAEKLLRSAQGSGNCRFPSDGQRDVEGELYRPDHRPAACDRLPVCL